MSAGSIQKELALLVTGKDVSATKTLRGVNREISKLSSIAGKAGRNVARNIESAVVLGAGAAAGAIGYAVKVAGDFQAQLNTINTIARTDAAGLDAIGNGIRDLSKKTGVGLDDLTNAYYDLLSAGVKVGDAQGVLTAAVTLGGGALATTSESVDLLTTALNAYGLPASQATHVSDLFAKSVELGKVRASEIAASLADVAPIAHTAGVGLEEIAASYGALTSQGVPAAEVTTQMSRAILELLKPSATLERLQSKLGKSYAKIAREKGLHAALIELRKDADKAKIPLTDLFGRVEGYKYLLETTGSQQKTYDDALLAMGDSAGTAAAQFAERQQGLNFQLGRLKANVDDAAITIGTQLLPVIADLAEQGVDWLGGHQTEIAEFAKELAEHIRDAVTWAKGLDWDGIGRALEAGAGFAGGIVTAFASAPPWVQQFLAGGFVANKFTGGAVGDLLGELGKGLIKGVLGMNAGVVNINAGVVNGGGGLGGAVGGGATGLAAKVGGGAKGALLTTAAVGIATVAVGEAVKTYFEVNQQSSDKAFGIGTQVADLLASNPTQEKMATALGAINDGITKIESNPLFVLVQGDALEQLKAMKAKLEAAIPSKAQVASAAVVSPDRLDERMKSQVTAVDAVYDSVERNRTTLGGKTDQLRNRIDSGLSSVVAAVKDLDLSVVVVNNITARDVSGAQASKASYASGLLANKAKLVPS